MLFCPAGGSGHAKWDNLPVARRSPFTVMIKADGVDGGSVSLTRKIRLGEVHMRFKFA